MWYALIALRIYLFMIMILPMYTKKSVRSKGEKPQPCTHECTLQQQILANNHFLTDLPLKKQTGFHSISG